MKSLKFFLDQFLLHLHRIIGASLVFFFPLNLYCLTSIQTTLSSGYYKDIEEKDHITLFYNLKLSEIHKKGYETFVEVDLNNHFVTDKWKIYPYQFYITVPLDNGFETAPFHNSRIEVGRQLLTEGFEINILNGIIYRNYWSPDFGIVFFGGSLDTLENNRISTEDQITGSSVFFKKFNTNFQLGPIMKIKENKTDYYADFSFMKSWDAPLAPLLISKNQWNIKESKMDQALAELDLSFKNFYLSTSFSSRRPDPLLLDQKRFIYKLFSTSHEKSLGTSLTWNPEGAIRIHSRVEHINYTSQAGSETGNLQELSFSFFHGDSEIYPSFTRIKSWGGTLLSFGLRFNQHLHKLAELNASLNIAKIDKINGIKGMLYDARGGFDYYFMPHFRAQIAVETERNHLFETNTRVALYVTHFYY